MSGQLSDRARALRGGGERPFLHMLRLAQQYERVISLGRGDPDLPTPPHIISAAKAALDRGETTYTAPAGMPELRKAVAGRLRHVHGLTYDPATEVIITSGTQEAIYLAMQCLVNPGDEVLVPEPYYAAYETSVTMAGGTLVRIPTRLEDDFEVRPGAIEAALTPRSRLLALASPNNPTGSVVTSDTKAAIARLVEARSLLVLADELYEHIVYDGLEVRSFATFPRMRERTILLNGVSKAYCMTGFRVGYLAGPAPLVSGMVEPHHTITICASTISQHAAMAALTGPQDCMQAYLAIYDQRRRTLASGLAAAGIRFGKPRGAFFIFADIRPTGLRSLDFCAQFLQRERVLIFPGNLYGAGGEGFVRISYLARLDELEEAMVRFERFFADLV